MTISGVSRISFRGGGFKILWKSMHAARGEATRLLGGSGAIWCVLESILLKFCQKNSLKNSHFFI